MRRFTSWSLSQIFADSLSPRLHFRSELHLARKAWHLGMGLLIAFVYHSGMEPSTTILTLGGFLALNLGIEAARLRNPRVNQRVIRLLGPIMRSSEVNRVSGVPHFLLSTILAIAIFPKPVAILSILYLACGDPIASLFGILYGSRSIRLLQDRSLIGTAAGVVTCALITWFFLHGQGMMIPESTFLALTIIGGLAGGTAELMPVDADDNLAIPMISGFVLWLAFILLGI